MASQTTVSGLKEQLDTRAASNQTMHIGTTSLAINRASAAQTLTGVSIDGNAATATRWAATRTLALTGNVTAAAANIDGTGNVSLSTTVANDVITNAMVNSAAAIADTKLATISTAGKVSNSATTATSANTASAIVARDASGNFSAGTITAALSGNASTATTATTASATAQTLTRGTYLTGNNFNGSTATTWAVDATEAATASKVVARDASGDINCRLVRPNFGNESTISGAMAYRVNNTTDNYIRFCSDAAAIRTFLNVPTRTGGDASGTWNINITGSAGSVGSSTSAYCLATNPTSAGTNSILRFQNTVNNVGSYYNTTNGRFTCPSTGRYFISLSIRLNGAAANSYGEFYLRINGTNLTYGNLLTAIISSASTQKHTFTIILLLNVNDYIELWNTSTGGTLETTQSSFTVYLLG